MKILMRTAAFVLAALVAGQTFAQSYPSKPIKVVVGYAAGGAVDVVARTIGQSLSNSMGQPVIVENKPGAGTNIAVKSVISAEPDGYTLMMAANALAANMALYQPMPFDAERDLVPVSLIGRVPVVIAANPSVPYANVKQLIDAAKGKPNSIAFGTPGNGSTPHMAVELFARAAGIDLQHVPYRGTPEALTETASGRIDWFFAPLVSALPLIQSGRLQALAVSTATRSPLLPNVPSISEAGFANAAYTFWVGLFVTAKTPKPIVQKLHAGVMSVLAMPDVKERLEKLGAAAMPMQQDAFEKYLDAETLAAAQLVKAAGIRIE